MFLKSRNKTDTTESFQQQPFNLFFLLIKSEQAAKVCQISNTSPVKIKAVENDSSIVWIPVIESRRGDQHHKHNDIPTGKDNMIMML